MAKINFIHPPDLKDLTRNKKIEIPPIPQKVIIPLSQHTGAPAQPVVNAGDSVKTGALIAEAKGFISSNIHSSISGKVIAIEDSAHPVFGSSMAIIIESDGNDEKAFPIVKSEDISSYSRDVLIDLIKNAGVVGLGGAMFPAHVKLNPPQGKKIATLIINGAECEPFLTCDHRVMLEKSKEIILGIQVLAKALEVKDVILAVEENKLDAMESLQNALFKLPKKPNLTLNIKKLSTRYPQGGEKQLIKTLLSKEVPSGGLPLDVGVVVSNVHTVSSVYEAVYLKKPLYERVVTVSGSFANIAKNVLVRIGTPIKDLLEFCGLDQRWDIYKVIMGGPMTGVAQSGLEAPVIKGTSGILVFDKRYKVEDKELGCIRCSRCIDACPVSIMPCMIGVAVNKDRFDIAGQYDVFDCIECGACGYVCPSKIQLVQLIKLAKAKIKR